VTRFPAAQHRSAATRRGSGAASAGPVDRPTAETWHAATLKNFALEFGWVEDGATVMRLLG
jgi:hypothetical protein